MKFILKSVFSKIVLVSVILCCFNKSYSQVIINEGFENAFPPQGWSLFVEGNGDNWQQDAPGTGFNSSHAMSQYTNDEPSNAWVISKELPLTSGISYRLSYWYKTGHPQIHSDFKVTLGRSAAISSQTTILHSYSASNTAYRQGIDIFIVPVSAGYHFAFNCISGINNSPVMIDSVFLEQISGTACTGIPTGTATSVTTICPDSTFVLNMTGTSGAGIRYQWQVSEQGQNNFIDIPNGDIVNISVSQLVSKDYRCINTCSSSGLTFTSNVISVSSPSFCYCTSAGSNCTNDPILNVSFAGINNSSGCSPAGYANYSTTIAPAVIAAGTTVPVSVKVGGQGIAYADLYIDFDKNGLFGAGEIFNIGSSSNTTINGIIQIPAGALTGLTRMRVKMAKVSPPGSVCNVSPLGEVEDYTVNITQYICPAVVPGTGQSVLIGPSFICSNTTFTLTLTGSFPGYIFRWESSPAGQQNYSVIPNATAQSLTLSQAVSTDYRCSVVCAATGSSTLVGSKAVPTPALCYCPIYNLCTPANTSITNVSFGSINNTSTCTTTGDYTSTVAPANITAGASVPLAVSVAAGAQSSSSVGVWIDYNKNTIFESNEFTIIGTYNNSSSYTGNVFIPSNALTGVTRMRVKRQVGAVILASGACTAIGSGEIEEYNVNILPAPIAIYFTPFADTLYNTVRNIKARIVQKDAGIDNSESFRPRLWAKRQGSSAWKSFKGQLVSGTLNDGEWDFGVNHDSVGVRRNGCDSVQFYFAAQDINTPFNIGYLPEVGASHTNVFTQATPPNQLFGYRIKPRLKDTVYVSASDCRYTSLTKDNGLFQEIKTRRLEGNITILIESDLSENGVHELNNYGLNGYSINIKPSGNTVRTINGFGFKGVLKMDNVQNVTIDGSNNGTGRNLIIKNSSTSPYTTDSISIITIRNGCKNLQFNNIIFQHDSYGIGVGSGGLSGENGISILRGNNTDIRILNSLFKRSNNTGGDQVSERHIMSFSGNDNIIIKGNEFTEFSVSAIKMYGASNNWIIDSNHFYNTSGNNIYGSTGLSMISVKGGGHQITNNFIGGQAAFCAGAPMNPKASFAKIELIKAEAPGTINPVLIANNHIDNISMGGNAYNPSAIFSGISTLFNHCIIRQNTIGNPASATGGNIVAWSRSIYGIQAFGYSEIKDNIITGISNRPGGGPDYDYVEMTGIALRCDTAVSNIFNSPNIISGNKVFSIKNVGASSFNYKTSGISVSGAVDNIIAKNEVYNLSRTFGTINGIICADGEGTGTNTVERNRIYNLVNYTSNEAYINGIQLSNIHNKTDVLNNQITLDNQGISSNANIAGILEKNLIPGTFPNGKIRLIYNSIFIGGTALASSPTNSFQAVSSPVQVATGTEVQYSKREIYNNILYNQRGGTVGNGGNYAVSFNSDNYLPALIQSLSTTKVNNNFYSLRDSATFLRVFYINTGYSKLWSFWKTTFNFDDSSYIKLPAEVPYTQLFLNNTTGNLNINSSDTNCLKVNNKAKTFTGITADFDSLNARPASAQVPLTDIGSDEFLTDIPEPGSICAGSIKTFTSDVAGTSYQWQLKVGNSFTDITNGTNYSGANTITLTLSNVPFLWSGRQFRCIINGLNFSQVFTLIVNESLQPSVSISTPVTTICGGDNVTFTATPINGGTAPVYQWKKNNQNVGTGISIYSSNTLVNGDVISVSLTSNSLCGTSNNTVSNSITINVIPALVMSAVISGNVHLNPVSPSTVLSLSVSNIAASPVYQWQDSTASNGWINISGANNTSQSYTLTFPSAKVRCKVSSTSSCGVVNTIYSNVLVLDLSSTGGLAGGGTGINPTSTAAAFRFYPNPAHSSLILDSLKLADNWQTFEVTTINGAQKILFSNISNRTSASINIETLPPGLYIGIMRRETGSVEYFKFIKL